MKKIFPALTLAVLTAAAPARAQDAAPAAVDPAFDQAIRAWVDAHPDYIIQSLNRFVAEKETKQRQDALGKAVSMTERFETDGTPFVIGNPEGAVELVYVMDAACPYCRRSTEEIGNLIEANPDLKVVQRWTDILGPASTYAAVVADIVWDQQRDKFRDFYHEMMSQTDRLDEGVVDRVLTDVVGQESADAIREKAMGGSARDAAMKNVAAVRSLISDAQIGGTPFFLVTGLGVEGAAPGYIDQAHLQSMIDKARAAAKTKAD